MVSGVTASSKTSRRNLSFEMRSQSFINDVQNNFAGMWDKSYCPVVLAFTDISFFLG